MATPVDVGPVLKRRAAWDVLPHKRAPYVMSQLGMMPGSPDGNEKEHRESNRRMAALQTIDLDLVTLISEFAGKAISRFILEYQSDGLPYLDDDEKDTLSSIIIGSSVTASRAVIANLIELELLTVNEDGGLEL